MSRAMGSATFRHRQQPAISLRLSRGAMLMRAAAHQIPSSGLLRRACLLRSGWKIAGARPRNESSMRRVFAVVFAMVVVAATRWFLRVANGGVGHSREAHPRSVDEYHGISQRGLRVTLPPVADSAKLAAGTA